MIFERKNIYQGKSLYQFRCLEQSEMKCLFTARGAITELPLSQSIDFNFSLRRYIKHERKVPRGGEQSRVDVALKNLGNSNKLTGEPDNMSRLAVNYRFPH